MMTLGEGRKCCLTSRLQFSVSVVAVLKMIRAVALAHTTRRPQAVCRREMSTEDEKIWILVQASGNISREINLAFLSNRAGAGFADSPTPQPSGNTSYQGIPQNRRIKNHPAEQACYWPILMRIHTSLSHCRRGSINAHNSSCTSKNFVGFDTRSGSIHGAGRDVLKSSNPQRQLSSDENMHIVISC